LANIACITGKVSGLVVVDLEYDGLQEAEKRGISSGLISITGKGRHLFFKHPGERVCNAVAMQKIKGFDLRGDGGYVLLPPSLHQTGVRYRWARRSALIAGATASFPESAFAQEKSVSNTLKPKDWIAEALEGLSNGNRNNTFAQVVGYLHGQRMPASAIRSLLLPHAMRVEFPENELDTVIRSVTSYPVGIRSNNGFSVKTFNGENKADTTKLNIRTFGVDWADYTKRKANTRDSEFATGYKRFDELLGGGLRRERLLRVAARTGVGKTNWLLGLCRSICESGKRVLYFSTELSYSTIWDRYIALVGSDEQARRHRLDVSDDTIPDLGSIRQAIIEHKPDVFIFDHIHNVSEEHSEVGLYIRTLADFAKEFRIPGVVAAQLNKNAYFIDQRTGKRVTPHMGMIKGASSILHAPGQVLILDEQDETPEERNILGVLDKNTDGEKGAIQFVLKKHPYRMEES